MVNDVRRIGKTQSLPEHSSSESLANDFARNSKGNNRENRGRFSCR